MDDRLRHQGQQHRPGDEQRKIEKIQPSDTLFIHIYNGTEENVFEYYEDDGISMNYKNGVFLKRKIIFDPDKKEFVFSKAEGSYVSVFKNIECIFHGFEDVKEMKVNGKEILLNCQTVKLLDGLRYLEEIYDPGYFRSLRAEEKCREQKVVVFNNVYDEIKINWK
jgi:alpha-glucosidase